jgi:hypothetical protein
MKAVLLYAYGDRLSCITKKPTCRSMGTTRYCKGSRHQHQSHRLETKKWSSQISHASDVAGHLRERPIADTIGGATIQRLLKTIRRGGVPLKQIWNSFLD